MDSENQRQTRRAVLAATGTAAAFGLAGCVGGDDDDGAESGTGNDGSDDGETEQTQRDEQTVTLLVEGVSGHDDEEEHDHSQTEGEDDQDEHHDYGHEGLTSEEVGHACDHIEEVEEFGAEDVEAGASAEGAPHLNEVHHPYSVTFEGESGYVLFELGDHDHDEEDQHDEEDDQDHDKENRHEDTSGEMLAFFTQNGVTNVVEGELVYSKTEAVESCGPIDRYVIVETHDGSAVVELTAEL